MNEVIKLALLLLFLGNVSIWCQNEITEEEKNEYIAQLDSANFMDAVITISRLKINEALPKIESEIWAQNSFKRLIYLDLMRELGSNKTVNTALAMVDSSVNMKDPLLVRVDATMILFKVGNFSTVNHYWEWLDKFHEGYKVWHYGYLTGLAYILHNMHEYESRAKEELIFYTKHHNNAMFRRALISHFEYSKDQDIINMLLDIARNDNDPYTRYTAYSKLTEFDYDEIYSFTKERLLNETINIYKLNYADTLLNKYGSPSDYNYVINYVFHSPYEYSTLFLKDYEPIIPVDISSLMIILDTLVSFANQSFDYSWLQDQHFKTELETHIVDAKTFLENGDSTKCYKEVEIFNNKVNSVYLDSVGSYPKFVSEEGWKFLYHYSNYILERLPEPLEDWQMRI